MDCFCLISPFQLNVRIKYSSHASSRVIDLYVIVICFFFFILPYYRKLTLHEINGHFRNPP